MALEIRVLGGFETRLDGVLLDLPTRKTRALLAHLALTAGKAHSRERLTALLWGDRPETQARQSFRQALAGLRRVLGPIGAQILRADDRHVTLDQSAVVIDAAEFEWLAAQPDTGALERAADLYRGDLLDGLEVDEAPFQEWLGTERERLRELYLEVLVRLLGAQMRADATQAAIRTAQRVLAADPLQESVHRALMRLYVRHGQRSAALRQYHVCVTAVRRELGVEPEPETQVLYREVLTSAASAMARGDDAGHRAGLTTPADPLVGRGAEMAWMRRALDAAWDGAPAVAILAGEAGVGKTRLIEELAAEAAQLGGTVLVGRGYESERLLPLRVWVDALRSSPAIAAADPAGSIPAAERAEAARVLPELGGELLPAPGGPHDVVRLFEALTGLLVDAAGRRPLLVVLEDLHVADELTVRLLAFLARRVRGVPLLLVGTLRDEDAAGEEVGRVLAQLERDNHASRLTLRPLAQPDCVTLATTLAHRRDPGLQTRLAEHVWRLSEGNPFVIVETVRALDAAGEAALPRLPRSVEEAIRGRLERLSQPAQALTAVAAVIGREFDFLLVQEAAGLSAADAAQALEELVRRRVVEPTGEEFRFVHERVRDVVVHQLLAPRRALLHRAVASALESHAPRLDDIAGRLAHHWAEAGDDDRAVVALRRLAAAASRRYALDEAVGTLRRALPCVERLDPAMRDRARLEVVVDLAETLFHTGRLRETLALLLEHEPLTARLATAHGLLAQYSFLLAHACCFVDTAARAFAHAERSLTHATAVDDRTAMGKAHYIVARACYRVADVDRGLDHARRALDLLGGTADLVWQGHAWWVIALLVGHRGRYGQALDAVERARSLAERSADRRLLAYAEWTRSWSEIALGDAAAAVASCRRAVAAAPDPFHRTMASLYLGSAQVESGDGEGAAATLEAVLRSWDEVGGSDFHRAFALMCLSIAHLRAGRARRARDAARDAIAAADKVAWPLALGRSHRALGQALRALGEWEPGERHLRAAVAVLQAGRVQPETAITQLALAKAVHQRGEAQEAAALLAAALGAFRSLGLDASARRAEALAARLGIAV